MLKTGINIYRQLILFLLLSLFTTTVYTHTNLSRYEIKSLLRHKIASINEVAYNPIVISEVKKRNSLNIPMDIVLKIDKSWSSYPIDHPVKKEMYETTVGKYLRTRVEFESSIFSEIFLTDNQGANITAWPITTDYWQGDEAKWRRSFNNGKGDTYIGKLEYDKSSATYAVQISVPVMDNKKAIGVLIAGIKLSYLQAKYLNKKHVH